MQSCKFRKNQTMLRQRNQLLMNLLKSVSAFSRFVSLFYGKRHSTGKLRCECQRLCFLLHYLILYYLHQLSRKNQAGCSHRLSSRSLSDKLLETGGSGRQRMFTSQPCSLGILYLLHRILILIKLSNLSRDILQMVII